MRYEIIGEITRETLAEMGDTEYAEVEINSNGGDIFSAIGVANRLRGKNTVIQVSGLCCSAATLILCSGCKVVSAANSLFMIHKPSVMLYSAFTAEEVEKVKTSLEKVEEIIKGMYRERTGREVELEETWLTAEEAKEFGLVDEIKGEVQVAADASKNIVFANNHFFNIKVPSEKMKRIEYGVARELEQLVKDQRESGASKVTGSIPNSISAQKQLIIKYANRGR